mmetsp:Transcript_41553/g.129264  ORF Transcript_41553/g.129264 Transcript_41553/m.129264 type:complete len:396 (+) Transcript_41553:111-1298(+)
MAPSAGAILRQALSAAALAVSAAVDVPDLQSADSLVEWMQQSRRPHLRPCWTELERSSCCNSTQASPSCFDRVFTREECCSGDSAVMIPLALPDALCVRPPVGRRRPVHPAHSPEQLRFERLHRRAVRHWKVELLGVTLHAVDFKTSMKVEIISDELRSDPYRLKALADHLEMFGTSNTTFLDIGANVGLVSMLLAKMNPASEVLALEPVPEFYRFLLWNLKLNGLVDRVWALNAGVGAEGCRSTYPTDAAFWWLPPALPWAHSLCLSFAEVLASMEVLSRFGFHSQSPVHFVKIDCEGCEYDVFQSDRSFELAGRRVQRFAGEVHDICNDCSAEAREEKAWRRVLRLLCGQGDRPNLAMGECEAVRAAGRMDAHLVAPRLDRRGPLSCPALAGA